MEIETQKAIKYFKDAVIETDEIIVNCSPALQAELVEQKEHFAVAVAALERKGKEPCEWISIKDRLPEPVTLSLVCIEGIENSVMIAQFNGEKWFRNNRKIIITHWMPLPVPPKEG